MRILFLGDVVSEPGCEFVRRKLPGFKKLQQIDFCIVNGENSAKGNGITPQSAEHLLASGADLLTTGNHVFKRPEAERAKACGCWKSAACGWAWPISSAG